MSGNNLNLRWEPQNQLKRARDRHRKLGDTAIASFANNTPKALPSPISPMIDKMVLPIQSPMIPALVRKMGENTLQTRRRKGNLGLWDGTPVKALVSQKIIADIDITNELSEFDSVGWEWRRRENVLCAHLTSKGKTYVVKIPGAAIQKIMNRCLRSCGEELQFREKTLDGMFNKLGNSLRKASRGVSPVRFVKNPKQFIGETSKNIKKLVKGVGRKTLNIVSSPIFGGVMAGLAAVPPLTAVGGAGLAAFAAANAVKPAYDALEKTIDTVDAVSSKKKGRAQNVADNFTNGLNSLPSPAKKLMTSALKSTDARTLTKGERNNRKQRAIFRLKESSLSRVR